MRTFFTLVLAMIASLLSYSQTTKTATNGDWKNASTWTPSGVPADGDIVEIPSGVTVTIVNTVYSTAPRPSLRIDIKGTLDFNHNGGDQLYLDNGSIIQIHTGGAIRADAGSDEIVFYNGATGTTIWKGSFTKTIDGPQFASATTGGFTLGVLPIKLKSFTAQALGNRIALNWSTDEELNTSHFVIERSANARNWSPVQTIAAKGEAAGYTATDATPAAGDNFYRLKSVDIDGKYEYSHVLKVVRGRSLSVHVSPNPATEQVTVSLSTPSSASVQLQLLSSNGQVVREKAFATGTSLIQFNLQGAAPGLYTLVLRNGNTVMETTQLLIK
jgi:hypothetical protein